MKSLGEVVDRSNFPTDSESELSDARKVQIFHNGYSSIDSTPDFQPRPVAGSSAATTPSTESLNKFNFVELGATSALLYSNEGILNHVYEDIWLREFAFKVLEFRRQSSDYLKGSSLSDIEKFARELIEKKEGYLLAYVKQIPSIITEYESRMKLLDSCLLTLYDSSVATLFDLLPNSKVMKFFQYYQQPLRKSVKMVYNEIFNMKYNSTISLDFIYKKVQQSINEFEVDPIHKYTDMEVSVILCKCFGCHLESQIIPISNDAFSKTLSRQLQQQSVDTVFYEEREFLSRQTLSNYANKDVFFFDEIIFDLESTIDLVLHTKLSKNKTKLKSSNPLRTRLMTLGVAANCLGTEFHKPLIVTNVIDNQDTLESLNYHYDQEGLNNHVVMRRYLEEWDSLLGLRKDRKIVVVVDNSIYHFGLDTPTYRLMNIKVLHVRKIDQRDHAFRLPFQLGLIQTLKAQVKLRFFKALMKAPRDTNPVSLVSSLKQHYMEVTKMFITDGQYQRYYLILIGCGRINTHENDDASYSQYIKTYLSDIDSLNPKDKIIYNEPMNFIALKTVDDSVDRFLEKFNQLMKHSRLIKKADLYDSDVEETLKVLVRSKYLIERMKIKKLVRYTSEQRQALQQKYASEAEVAVEEEEEEEAEVELDPEPEDSETPAQEESIMELDVALVPIRTQDSLYSSVVEFIQKKTGTEPPSKSTRKTAKLFEEFFSSLMKRREGDDDARSRRQHRRKREIERGESSRSRRSRAARTRNKDSREEWISENEEKRSESEYKRSESEEKKSEEEVKSRDESEEEIKLRSIIKSDSKRRINKDQQKRSRKRYGQELRSKKDEDGPRRSKRKRTRSTRTPRPEQNSQPNGGVLEGANIETAIAIDSEDEAGPTPASGIEPEPTPDLVRALSEPLSSTPKHAESHLPQIIRRSTRQVSQSHTFMESFSDDDDDDDDDITMLRY